MRSLDFSRSPHRAPATAKGLVLLLIEDNPGDILLAREHLSEVSEYAFEILQASRLDAAIEILSDTPVDVVVLDLNLPDSRGIDTLRRLHAAHDDVAIVVQSGEEESQLRRRVLLEGAQDFIGKNEWTSRLLARSVMFAAERFRAQAQQRQIERLVSLNPDAVMVVDRDGLVLYANEAAADLFDKPRDALVGSPVSIPVERGTRSELTIDQGRDSRHAEVRSQALEWNGEEALLVSLRDVTEKRKLSEQLRQSQKMEALGRLAGGIAHDFNNLLTIILNYALFVQDDLAEGDPRREDVQEILRASESARSLTSQLLAFSRRQKIQPHVLDLNEVLQSLHRMLRRTLPEDISLVVVPTSDAWPVFADQGQVEQMLMNLAVNASDAMESGGTCTFEVRNVTLNDGEELAPGDYVALEVRDTGPGIREEIREQIFEPFFTTKAAGKGTGLGLATCYGIAQQAGGTIVVESEPGEGACFRILLPRCRSDMEESSSSLPRPMTLDGSERILVVEDEPVVLQSIVRILRDHGYQALSAMNGEEALRRLEQADEEVELVLTDLVMPQMSGRELVDVLVSNLPRLPIVLMTGYSDQELIDHRIRGLDLPMVFKPFVPQELLSAIRQALDLGAPAE